MLHFNSYKYGGRIPNFVLNVLSYSTWRVDLVENVDLLKYLGIHVYVVYTPFKTITSALYYPPFLRVYILNEDGSYKQIELRNETLTEGGVINEKNIIDISDRVPFRIGLMKLKTKVDEKYPLYQFIFLDPSDQKILEPETS